MECKFIKCRNKDEGIVRLDNQELSIFGKELSPQNMVRVKWGGVLKFAGGLMGVAYEEALMKGGRAFLSICLL